MPTAIIADDEELPRRELRRMLAEVWPALDIVAECEHGTDALEAIYRLQPDIAFLDIRMPGLTGLEVAQGIEGRTRVVFVTAYDEFALRAFEVNAVDYLLKPIDGQRLQAAVERVRARTPASGPGAAARLAAALDELGRHGARRWCRRLAIRGAGRVRLVEVAEIDRIEAAGNYVQVHQGRTQHLLRETMAGLEGRLDPDQFVRVSRAAIVNIDRVRELQPMFNGDFVVLLKDGTEVAGSRRYRDALQALFG